MKRLSEARRTIERAVPGDEEPEPPELGGFVEWLQQPGVRARLKEVFSRKMLGSVILAATTTRIIETTFAVVFGAMSPIRVLGWIATWFVAIFVFVSWDYILAASADKAETAADKAEKVTDEAEKQATKKSPRAAAKPAKRAEQTADTVEKMLDDAEKKAKRKAKEKARDITSQDGGSDGSGQSSGPAKSGSGTSESSTEISGSSAERSNESDGSH